MTAPQFALTGALLAGAVLGGAPKGAVRRDASMTAQPSVLPGRHILVVDDDTQLREQVAAYLAEHGFQVHTAADAREMDAALAAAPVDLVVLDLMLPGEDGL